jgi:hypothetical protein
MQENIPAGLQALMQASSVLQQTASPVAPGPQGEQPTVAGRIMQQMPGVAQAGRQAGIANAMLMQRLQQKQQMAQDPEMIARMAAQMMRQGVAGLPAPMQFKDGGIIGFQQGGSPRIGTEEWEEARRKEMERRGITNPFEGVGRAIIEALTPSGPIGAGVRERRQAELEAAQRDPNMVLAPPFRAAPPEAGSDVVQALPEAQTEKVIPSETGAQMGPVSRREAPPPQAKEPPKPDIVEALMAQLTPPESMAKPAAPTAEGIMAQAKALGPQGDALAARRQIAAEREKAIARMPDLEAEGIKALEEAKAARKALLEQRKADDSWRSLRAFFNQLYTRGNDFAVVQDGIRVREEQDKLADLNHAQAVLKLRAAQQAKALGKFDRADELEKDALEQENKSRGHLINTFQVAAQLAGQVNNTDSQWISHALNRRSSEILKLAELRNSLNERKDNDAVNRIRFLQQQLNAALDDVNKIKSKPLYQTLLSTVAIKAAKNQKLTPEEEAQLATMREEIQKVEEASNYKNLRSLVDAEIAKYTGVAAPARQNRMRFDIEGKPVQ